MTELQRNKTFKWLDIFVFIIAGIIICMALFCFLSGFLMLKTFVFSGSVVVFLLVGIVLFSIALLDNALLEYFENEPQD